jgi:hypothetical protein
MRSREEQAVARFLGVDMLFAGRHVDRVIIILCVRWYLRFKLSFRDLVEMMAERALPLAHTMIMPIRAGVRATLDHARGDRTVTPDLQTAIRPFQTADHRQHSARNME